MENRLLLLRKLFLDLNCLFGSGTICMAICNNVGKKTRDRIGKYSIFCLLIEEELAMRNQSLVS